MSAPKTESFILESMDWFYFSWQQQQESEQHNNWNNLEILSCSYCHSCVWWVTVRSCNCFLLWQQSQQQHELLCPGWNDWNFRNKKKESALKQKGKDSIKPKYFFKKQHFKLVSYCDIYFNCRDGITQLPHKINKDLKAFIHFLFLVSLPCIVWCCFIKYCVRSWTLSSLLASSSVWRW